ncbi:MAG: SDR family oxidoreductase [Gemmatimonadota bacterium]
MAPGSDAAGSHPDDGGPWALVTGASGGLGAEMARVLARKGTSAILTARSKASLERLARELGGEHGVATRVMVADLAQPGAGHRLAARILDECPFVEMLVNNAGFGQWGFYPGLDGDEETEMLRLNMEALTALTRGLLPPMLARGRGRILNVASTAAFLPGPGMTVYYATKAYVLSYSEGLGEELRGTGVTVTCLCPGPTPTGFQERSGADQSGLLSLAVVPPERVAREGIDGMLRGRPRVVPGWVNRVTTLLPRFLPRSWVPKLVKRVQGSRSDGTDA